MKLKKFLKTWVKNKAKINKLITNINKRVVKDFIFNHRESNY